MTEGISKWGKKTHWCHLLPMATNFLMSIWPSESHFDQNVIQNWQFWFTKLLLSAIYIDLSSVLNVSSQKRFSPSAKASWSRNWWFLTTMCCVKLSLPNLRTFGTSSLSGAYFAWSPPAGSTFFWNCRSMVIRWCATNMQLLWWRAGGEDNGGCIRCQETKTWLHLVTWKLGWWIKIEKMYGLECWSVDELSWVLLWCLFPEHRSEPKWAQLMARCLTAPSHYLNQYWLVISRALCHSPKGNSNGHDSNHCNAFEH